MNECGNIDISQLLSKLNSIEQKVSALESRLGVLEGLLRQVLALIQMIVPQIQQSINALAAEVRQAISAILPQIQQSIQQLLPLILSGIQQLLAPLAALLRGIAEAIEAAFANLIALLGGRGRTDPADIERILAAINALSAQILALESRLINQINNVLITLRSLLNQVLSAILDMQGTLIRQINAFLTEMRALIQGAVASILAAIARLGSPNLDEIKQAIAAAKAEIVGVVNTAKTEILNAIAKIAAPNFDEIKKAIESAKNEILAAINKIKPADLDEIKKAIAAAKTEIVGVVNSAKTEILEAIKKIAPPNLDEIKKAIDAAKNEILSAISKIKPADLARIEAAINGAKAEILAAIRGLKFPTLEQIAQLHYETRNDIKNFVARYLRNLNFPTLEQIKAAINDALKGFKPPSVDLSPILKRLGLIDVALNPTVSGSISYVDCTGKTQTISYSGKGISGLTSQLKATNTLLATQLYPSTCTVGRIYKILGGDDWFSPRWGDGNLWRNPEYDIQSQEATIYDSDSASPKFVVARGLPEYLQTLFAVNYHRAGHIQLPVQMPSTLLSYGDGTTTKFHDMASWFNWFIQQVDGLIGQFPIKLDIQDTDPTTPGNQSVHIELPNISETLAEMYGLLQSTASSGDISINFLMRLAAEVISTKNSSLITQDHVKCMTAFLGYKGGPASREVTYAFNPKGLDSLETILKRQQGYVIGWRNNDNETLTHYIQKLLFSAGIIKAAFFANKDELGRVIDEVEGMGDSDDPTANAKWADFLKLINDAESKFNSGDNPIPKIKNK